MNLQTLMGTAIYHDGGRGPVLFDCWGWVRYIRHHLYGQSLLSSWGQVRVDDLKNATRAWNEELVDLDEGPPQESAIATVYRGLLMVHVGIVISVDGMLMVSDITPNGARLLPLYDFESQYLRVAYYHDRASTSHSARQTGNISR